MCRIAVKSTAFDFVPPGGPAISTSADELWGAPFARHQGLALRLAAMVAAQRRATPVYGYCSFQPEG